jgi:hypothetical protein
MTMTDTELAHPHRANTLSIADVDLVVISLRALLTSVSALVEPGAERER